MLTVMSMIALRRLAAEVLAGELGERAGEGRAALEPPSRHAIERAQRFLDEEEFDYGIVVGRGNLVAFWHLTFQEYLAARAIAGRPDGAGLAPVRSAASVLPAGMARGGAPLRRRLAPPGRPKVDGLIKLALDRLGARPTLAEEARSAGLLGAMLRDLQPPDYAVADARYLKLLDEALGVFEAARSLAIAIATIEAADARRPEARARPSRSLRPDPGGELQDGCPHGA